MTSHEIVVTEVNSKMDERTTRASVYLHERKVLAQELGLDAQVEGLTKEIAVVERGNRLQIPALTPEELTVWQEWFPTCYVEDWDHGGDDLIRHYDFDRIPKPVLAKWKALKEGGLFDRFEIWSPERRTVSDPALMGVIGTSYYLLARWGESDANLLSFDDIRRKVLVRFFLMCSVWGAFLAAFAGWLAAVIVTEGFTAPMLSGGGIIILLTTIIGFSVAPLTFVWTSREFLRRVLRAKESERQLEPAEVG